MVIDNSIKFADLAIKLQLENNGIFLNYFDGFSRTCKCKPSIRQLYLDRMQESYVNYVNKNSDYIKQKIESSDINDSIIEFKNNSEIFCVLNLHKNAL